ncbi:MAG TPA: septum formation protein Maf, partial [Acidimicrobiaceae bacterium]|nr:septum formation protein Maf [Acidimicrobiaceae bacterium]
MDKQLVLASSSPRRKELLSFLGVDFIVSVPDVDESLIIGEKAEEYVQRVASQKVLAVEGFVVLGADTCVVLEDQIYGKPVDLDNAEFMLRALSGKVHQVVSGVAVRTGDQLAVTVVRTDVEFVPLDQRLIDWYLGLGESLDKAGSYALQGAGASLVKAISGSHSNVIGLPLV